ncbi:MAG: MFS transporter [Opitutae bacterium]|nr:MFS transporter [Opitutae bacterium]MCD8298800.1 MFS transporter [Opitutae bacterium]
METIVNFLNSLKNEAGTAPAFDKLVIGLMLVVIVIIVIQAIRKGVKNVSNLADPSTRAGLWAWVAVVLLWVVVMLNYFDRQLLSVVRAPIVHDIPMSDAQFGAITSAFLLIYAVLSPIGGFIADRYSRRLVIFGSLIVWSTVTWWTGHAQDYKTLFVARAAMGISEAFYIPAALALITDFHRGNTRSLATGIHMSGIYAGMALAGFGATMSDHIGWRMTFALFGLVGVLYAFVLIVFLKDPGHTPADNAREQLRRAEEAAAAATDAQPASAEGEKPAPASADFEKLSGAQVFARLLSSRPMWILLFVVAFAGAGNWFLLTWYPTLLQDTFNLTPGEAGPQATLWSSIAKYVAVIVAAIIADRWVQKNLRARALVPGISFAVAGPCVVIAVALAGTLGGVSWLLYAMLALVAMQGVAQGSLDATLMPVMRSHIDERYSATGYGLLNLTSAGVGALISFFGGWFKDQGVPLTTTLAVAGTLMFICGVLFFVLPKPTK